VGQQIYLRRQLASINPIQHNDPNTNNYMAKQEQMVKRFRLAGAKGSNEVMKTRKDPTFSQFISFRQRPEENFILNV
jgi:hypothetical protein